MKLDLDPYLDPLLMITMAINFFAMGVSQVRAVVYGVALQGALIGLLPLLVHPELETRAFILTAGAVGIKGVLIPWFLLFAMREVDIVREVRPVVDFIPGLLLVAVGTALALVFTSTLPLVEGHGASLLVPAALSTVFAGFLILTTRKVAILQVLGFLVLENGTFAFGMLLVGAMPFLVEVGVLLDVFTGVFVMGIIINHINREIASVSTEHFSELKD